MRILRNLTLPGSKNITDHGIKLFETHIWPFLLESEWTFVDKLDEADIVPFLIGNHEPTLLESLNPKQTALFLSIFHIDDFQDYEHYSFLLSTYKKHCNTIIVHKNRAIPDQKGLVYYDSMFNRHKLYYTEFSKIESYKSLLWTYGSSKETYNLPTGKFELDKCKHFLSPNLIYHSMTVPRMRYRQGLNDFLNNKYQKHGFINSKENLFYPNNPSETVKERLKNSQGGFWYPIADDYYKSSFFSIYVETLTVDHYDVKCVTEKTFDPIIKGNFILPFGKSKFIADLREYYGFMVPFDGYFMDYSYERHKDNDVRFYDFLCSIDKVFNNYSFSDILELYNNYKWMHEHNRQIFFDRPYHKLHDKIAENIWAKSGLT